MNDYIIDKRFIKTLPLNIHERLHIAREVEKNTYLIKSGKIDGHQCEILKNTVPRVYRCRINDGARIHAIEENNKLRFFDYSSSAKHDSSIEKIIRMNLKKERKDFSNEFIELTQSSIVVLPTKEESVEQVIRNNTYIYELDLKQSSYTNYIHFLPIIVKGTAGSGKTSIAIDMIKNYLQKEDGKIAYFTYNKNLCDNLVNTLEDNDVDTKNLSTFSLNDNSINQLLNNNYNITDYYDEWYSDCKLPNKKRYYNIAKHEIRNIIKGYAGKNWDNFNNNYKFMDFDSYINFKNNYFISEEAKKEIYMLAKKYQEWLINNNKLDENDVFHELYKSNIKKFDYIIIDEVQDLTENEIKSIISTVKNKENIMLCGDIHQTLNNYQFDFGRVSSFLKKIYNGIDPYVLNLTKNYRNSKKVVDYINELRNIRNKDIGNLGQADEAKDDPCRIDDTEESLLTICNDSILDELINDIKGTNTTYITFNEKDYKELKNKISDNDEDNIFDIFEIKGLEFQNIILYHPLESCLLNEVSIARNNKNTRSAIRIGFNHFFTAVTRTKNSLMICDNEINPDVDSKFFSKEFIYLNHNSTINDTGFRIITDPEEWNAIAEEYEAKCEYNDYKLLKYILNRYKKAGNIEKINELNIILKYSGLNEAVCAQELFDNKFYAAAYNIYLRLNMKIETAIMLLYQNKQKELHKYMISNSICYNDMFNHRFGKQYINDLLNDIDIYNKNINKIKELLNNGK